MITGKIRERLLSCSGRDEFERTYGLGILGLQDRNINQSTFRQDFIDGLKRFDNRYYEIRLSWKKYAPELPSNK